MWQMVQSLGSGATHAWLQGLAQISLLEYPASAAQACHLVGRRIQIQLLCPQLAAWRGELDSEFIRGPRSSRQDLKAGIGLTAI